MSAVLTTPTLPAFINMEDLKAFIQSEIEKGIEKALPAAVEKVLSNPENPILIKTIESILAISELKILKRLYTHDVMLGLQEPYEAEDYVSIPAQIKALEQKEIIPTEKAKEEKRDDSPIIPNTTLELKACELMVHLQEDVKPNWANEICMNTQEFYHFMKTTVSEKLRWKPDLRNPRQAKKDIMSRAVEMYPNLLELKKDKSGNKLTGIALKPSVKRTDTYAC